MKYPAKILEGPAFDWEEGKLAMEALSAGIARGEEPNMGYALCADPGLIQCPGCKEYVWNEAPRMLCECGSECGQELKDLLFRSNSEG